MEEFKSRLDRPVGSMNESLSCYDRERKWGSSDSRRVDYRMVLFMSGKMVVTKTQRGFYPPVCSMNGF